MFDGCQDDRSHSINSLEHVQLLFKGSSGRRGNVEISIVSPAGTRYISIFLCKIYKILILLLEMNYLFAHNILQYFD
jgi:hypothetical protein